MLSKYMSYEYEPGARGEDNKIDCWGLVRLIRHEVFGFPLLPSFADAKFGDSKSIQSAHDELDGRKTFMQIKPRAGAIVAVMRRGVCLHVAVMIDRFTLIEIKRKGSRARIVKLADWLQDYPPPVWEVYYYCDQQ